MDEKNINISKSEEELLEIMENRSHITAGQLHNLEEDEECLQACSDLAEIVIEMQKEQNLLAIDVRKELADFRNKHSKNDRRKNTRILWASVTGVAAAVAIILVLRAMMISSQPEIIKVFQANHIAQEVTLQVNDEKEIKPLKEVVESLSSYSTAQLSSKEIDYSRALLQTETKEVGKQKVQIHRLSIPRGETFKVVLSEGTEVFLNSDSRLAYPTVFKGKERVVSLEGEAYFKVAKDAAHPFIVKSGNLQIRVLGTEFNVRSYSPTDVRVTLITGKVAVSDTCGVHSVEMVPGQSVQLSSDGTFAVNVDQTLQAVICKNLFLCNRQETAFYLLMIPDTKVFHTKDLSAQIGAARLSFAKPEYMEKFLDITPGSVSVLGLMNDTGRRVQLLIDEDVLNSEFVGCHPCINTSSLRLRTKDLIEKILPAVEHDFIRVKL